MKKKLSLSEIRVKSFPTSARGGLIAEQEYDTVHSGVCTCFMFCNSEPRLNCTQVCPDEIEVIQLSDRC